MKITPCQSNDMVHGIGYLVTYQCFVGIPFGWNLHMFTTLKERNLSTSERMVLHVPPFLSSAYMENIDWMS